MRLPSTDRMAHRHTSASSCADGLRHIVSVPGTNRCSWSEGRRGSVAQTNPSRGILGCACGGTDCGRWGSRWQSLLAPWCSEFCTKRKALLTPSGPSIAIRECAKERPQKTKNTKLPIEHRCGTPAEPSQRWRIWPEPGLLLPEGRPCAPAGHERADNSRHTACGTRLLCCSLWHPWLIFGTNRAAQNALISVNCTPS